MTLVKLYMKKHQKFWNRTWKMHEKFNWIGKFTGFIIALLMISLGYYIMLGFSIFTDFLIFIFNRNRFKYNMEKAIKTI
jgi:hypothetical protein